MKKVLSFFAVVFAVVFLVACGDTKYTVEFDPDGGVLVGDAKKEVKEGDKVAKPADPTKRGFNFEHWLLGDAEYDFDKPVKGNLKLKAKWAAESFTVVFDLGIVEGTAPANQTVFAGEKVAAVDDPVSEGFEFIGWFVGGTEYNFEAVVEENLTLTAKWEQDLDDADAEAALYTIELPGKVSADLTLPVSVGDVVVYWSSSNEDAITFAGKVTQAVKNSHVLVTATAGKGVTREYWIQVYGSEVDLDATYSASFGEIQTLNPLMSEGESDSDVYSYLVSYLYGTDYDWELAMENGHADYPGDFSKIKSERNPNGTVDMPSIKRKVNLDMAAKYPYAVNKKTDNAVEGSYGVLVDQVLSKELLDNQWIIEIRKDLKFADGTPINVDTYEYSFKEYLNGDVNNVRANYLYNGDYIPLVNGKEYYDQLEGITWEDVGFKKLDDYRFQINLTSQKTQYHVMIYLSIINLVHPESYESGFNETGSANNYGSVDNPLVSYGPFTLANNYEDTEIFTFTRNPNYHLAWDVPFKTINGPIIKDQEDIINEFKAGRLDVAGVGGEFWNEFQDNPNLYISPSNSFYRLAISLERPDGKAKPILGYEEFRKALYLATDRLDFANNVQPPSQGKLGYLSNIHQVSEWASQAYASSTLFKQQLEALGLKPEQGGYDSEEAMNLFKEARTKAIADGHYTAGEVIKIEFLYYDAGSNTRIANWVKAQYEEVFNADGNNNFEVVLNAVSNDELSQQRNAGDFDLVFTGMNGATFQATFGMGYIFSPSFSNFLVGKGHGIPTKPVSAEIINLFSIVAGKDDYTGPRAPKKADFTVDGVLDEEAYDAAVEAYEEALELFELPEGMRTETEQDFFERLEETEGVFSGTFDELFLFWNGIPELDVDYEGQEEDLTAITAALEKALLEQMIAIPLFSSTSAAVYSEKVVRLAHAYSLFMGWGGMSYMYKTK